MLSSKFSLELSALIARHLESGIDEHECSMVLHNFTNYVTELASNKSIQRAQATMTANYKEMTPDVWELQDLSTEEIELDLTRAFKQH